MIYAIFIHYNLIPKISHTCFGIVIGRHFLRAYIQLQPIVNPGFSSQGSYGVEIVFKYFACQIVTIIQLLADGNPLRYTSLLQDYRRFIAEDHLNVVELHILKLPDFESLLLTGEYFKK